MTATTWSTPRRWVAHVGIGVCAAAIVAGRAADAAEANPEPSKETRAQMAQMHDAMAACLRSDRSLAVCRDEVRTKYKGMMGHGHCGMMDETATPPN
jgi:hypothetical protein